MAAAVLKRIATDMRFYAGTLDGHILVFGYSQEWAGTSHGCPGPIDDGGATVWRIRFDVKRGTFDQFEVNGEL